MEVLMGKSSNIYKLDSLVFYPVAMFDYRRVARLYDTDIGNFLQVCSLDCTYLERITPAKGTMIPKYDLQTYSSHFQWPLISRLVSIKMFMLYHVISTQQHDLGQKSSTCVFRAAKMTPPLILLRLRSGAWTIWGYSTHPKDTLQTNEAVYMDRAFFTNINPYNTGLTNLEYFLFGHLRFPSL